MRGVLKGIDSARARLSDGTVRTYYYAWRGGPRLPGSPGDPEFVAAYNRALGERPTDAPNARVPVLEGLVDAYLDSQDFAVKSARTQVDYRKQAKAIVKEFGDLPIVALADKRARVKHYAPAGS